MGSASTSVESLLAEVSDLRTKNAALEQKLEASEVARRECGERFCDLAENIQEVFWICTPDLTNTLYISPAYEEIWGRSCQSLYENPRSFIDAIYPHDRDRITTRIKSQGWEEFCEEYRIIRPDGEIRWIRDRAWPVRDESGKTIRVAGIAQDISSHKAAEASLRKYEQMVSTTPDLMAFVDTNYRYQAVNKRYEEVFEKPQELVIGRLVVDILGAATFERIKPKIDECFSGKPVNYQHWLDTPKEGKRYFDVHYHPAVNSDGSVFGVVADVRDLTDLKLVEQSLRENQIFLTAIVENIPDMIFVKDAKNLQFLRFNEAGEKLIGYPREALIGKTDYDFFPKSEADFYTTKDREVLSGKTLLDIPEEVIQSKSQGTRYLHTKKIPILDDHGTPQYLLGISEDITDQKERQILLEAMQQAQSQFILGNDPAEMFDHLLQNLLSITRSEYGFIGEVLFTPEGTPYLKTQAITNIAWNQETRELYDRFAPNLEFYNLNTLFGKVITTGQPVVANDPMNDPRGGGLPKGHPPMHAFLGLPFYRGDRLVGMVGIANRAEGYDAQLIAYLQPLLSTCGMLIEAHQNSQQRIQAETTLRATEQMYRQILDSISDMVFLKDKNFKLLWANKAFRSYYNMTNEELRGILDAPFNEPEFTKQYNEADAYVLNTGKILNIPEEPVTQHDGQVHLFHTIKAPLFGENGEVVKLVGVSRDITKRKATEEVIRKGERKFRAIYEQAPTGIAILDSLSGRFTQINRRYCDIAGYSQKEMLDRTFQDITYPDDLQADLDNIQQLLAGEISSFKREKRYIRKSGEVIWVNLTCVPLWLESTDPRQHMTMVEDITYRKKAEKALQESEERFRLLNEAIPQQVWSAKPDGSIDYVNQRVLQYFDCSFEDIIDRGWQRFLHPDDLPGCLERWDKARDTKQPYEIEFRLLGGKDHSFRWHLGRALPIFDQDGQVVKWFGTNTDITQFKQLENQIRQSQKMEAIGTLAGGIAHDFNNILMAITGYAELATFNSKGNNAAQRNLQEVLVAGQRAKELVQQILAFSRQTEHERQPIELKSVVKEVCKLLRASLPTTVEIRQNFTKAPTIILGDPIQMHQVVMNLCANAEHAMRESGGLLELKVEHVTGEPDDRGIHPDLTGASYVRLTVRDTGAGMTQDVAERIFDPFFTTKGVGEGTGMGLAVVHGIVASHGGAIHVESEPGQGSTFTIDFPEMEARSTQGDKKPLEQEYLMGHGNILFVEDEEALARLGKEAMTGLGYEVMMRTSSVEALEAFRADPLRFDAVVTDQTMPNMTGEALSRELLHIRPDVPIILCTGFSHNMTLEKAKAMGIRAFLLKPLLIKDLARTLHEVLHP